MSDTTTSTRRYSTRKRVEYAACWPLYLTPAAKSGVERIWARYTEASRAKIMRVLMDLAIEVAERDPAVLLPLMTPQLLVQDAAPVEQEPAKAETKEDESNEDLVESLGVTTPEVCNPFKS